MTEPLELSSPGALPEEDGREVLARLYGEPVFSIPRDLYIPPDALRVFLESFEGPLDFLLWLIRRQRFNVMQIPMARLTEQYMQYVELIRRSNLELAADYLVMAAQLMRIKSRLLLPRAAPEEDGEEEDPQAELARRLLEYERMKLAARRIDEMPRMDREWLRTAVFLEQAGEELLPQVRPEDLRRAWEGILQDARLSASHRVAREELSVREHMTRILRLLSERPRLTFPEVFTSLGEVSFAGAVASYLALLELAKENLVTLTQAAAFSTIYVEGARSVRLS